MRFNKFPFLIILLSYLQKIKYLFYGLLGMDRWIDFNYCHLLLVAVVRFLAFFSRVENEPPDVSTSTKTVEEKMSAGCETGNETVSALFDKGLAIYDELCNTMHPSSSKEYQVSSISCFVVFKFGWYRGVFYVVTIIALYLCRMMSRSQY